MHQGRRRQLGSPDMWRQVITQPLSPLPHVATDPHLDPRETSQHLYTLNLRFIHYNIDLPSTPRYSVWSLPYRLCYYIPCHMELPAYSFWCYHSIDIRSTTDPQSMKPLSVKFSTLPDIPLLGPCIVFSSLFLRAFNAWYETDQF